MADMATLERALVNADAAGDTSAAQTLAGEISRMRATTQPVARQPEAVTPAEQPSVVADVAKAAPVGVARGVIGLAGIPGDLQTIAQNVSPSDWLTRNLGEYFPNAMKFLREESARTTRPGTLGAALSENSADAVNVRMPTSQQIQSAVEGATGPFYQAKTVPGKFAQTAGEFAPAILGGPESLLTKAVTRVAAPAVASETAGQLTEGTAFEPYARVGAAILGGATASKVAASRALAKPAAPTVDEIESAASSAYRAPEVAALELHPSSTSYTAGKITNDLNRSGFRELTAPQTYSIVQELKSPLGKTAKTADVQSVRTALGKVAGNFANPTEQAAANKAIAGIDDYLANLKPYDIAAGNGSAASAILSEAKGNYAAAKRASRFNDAEYRAELNAATANSGGNVNNATRQAIKSILNSPKKRRGFSPEEIDQMERVVKGTATGNVMRAAGRILGGGGGLGTMLTAGAGYGAAGGPLGLALPAVGFTAKTLGDLSTRRQVRLLDDMIRSRSPLAQQRLAATPTIAAPSLTQNSLLAGLLSSSALQQQPPLFAQQNR